MRKVSLPNNSSSRHNSIGANKITANALGRHNSRRMSVPYNSKTSAISRHNSRQIGLSGLQNAFVRVVSDISELSCQDETPSGQDASDDLNVSGDVELSRSVTDLALNALTSDGSILGHERATDGISLGRERATSDVDLIRQHGDLDSPNKNHARAPRPRSTFHMHDNPIVSVIDTLPSNMQSAARNVVEDSNSGTFGCNWDGVLAAQAHVQDNPIVSVIDTLPSNTPPIAQDVVEDSNSGTFGCNWDGVLAAQAAQAAQTDTSA